jgi:hypothetical protein
MGKLFLKPPPDLYLLRVRLALASHSKCHGCCVFFAQEPENCGPTAIPQFSKPISTEFWRKILAEIRNWL